MFRSSRLLLVLAIIASLFSFAKFSHCQKRDWTSPDNYIHACYTDIAPLYAGRGLDKKEWPFSTAEKSVEYPVLLGIAMYVTALPVSNIDDYYFLNIFLIALLFIASLFILERISDYGFYFALAPPVVASLFINWDMWAIPTMLLAIYWFDKGKYQLSALVLGVSIATKFFPVYLLIPIAILLYRRNQSVIKYIGYTALSWLAINLPVAIISPEGWWHFYKFNMQRGADWGSIWNVAQIAGWSTSGTNLLTTLLTLIIFASFAGFLTNLRFTPKLAEVSFILFALTFAVGKVYSPQYVIWLTALAVIALNSKQTLITFWIWQFAELMYHVAIWQHLATLTNARFGLSAAYYGAISLIRILASVGMSASIAHELNIRTNGRQGTESYA